MPDEDFGMPEPDPRDAKAMVEEVSRGRFEATVHLSSGLVISHEAGFWTYRDKGRAMRKALKERDRYIAKHARLMPLTEVTLNSGGQLAEVVKLPKGPTEPAAISPKTKPDPRTRVRKW
jgi:hypothetical protein